MPIPAEEPNITVRDVIADNFDTSNITKTFKTAWVHTGWFNEDSNNPQITVSGVSEPTEPNALDPTGKGLAAWVDGTLDVNVWVPEDSSYNSAGAHRNFRYELRREVHRVIENNQTGTGDLSRITTGTAANDPAEPPPPYRAQIEVLYQYHTSPE